MAKHETDYTESGSLLWTGRLAAIVSAPATALICLGAAFLAIKRPPGDSALFNAFMITIIAGACGVFVAVSGWLGSLLYLRAEGLTIPEIPHVTHVRGDNARRRVRIRRRNGLAVIASLGTLILTTGALGALWWEGGLPGVDALIFIGFGATLVVTMYAAFASWFVVTPEHLRIDTMLTRETVPRHLLESFSSGPTDVRLHLRIGGDVRFRVDSPFEDFSRTYRENRGAQIRTLNRIVRALSAVPGGPDETTEVVVVTRRWCVVGAVAAVVASVIAVLIAGR